MAKTSWFNIDGNGREVTVQDLYGRADCYVTETAITYRGHGIDRRPEGFVVVVGVEGGVVEYPPCETIAQALTLCDSFEE